MPVVPGGLRTSHPPGTFWVRRGICVAFLEPLGGRPPGNGHLADTATANCHIQALGVSLAPATARQPDRGSVQRDGHLADAGAANCVVSVTTSDPVRAARRLVAAQGRRIPSPGRLVRRSHDGRSSRAPGHYKAAIWPTPRRPIVSSPSQQPGSAAVGRAGRVGARGWAHQLGVCHRPAGIHAASVGSPRYR